MLFLWFVVLIVCALFCGPCLRSHRWADRVSSSAHRWTDKLAAVHGASLAASGAARRDETWSNSSSITGWAAVRTVRYTRKRRIIRNHLYIDLIIRQRR